MSSVVISGDTSGTISLTATPVAGSNTITLPALSGTAVLDTATQTLTNKTLTSPTITGAVVSSMASSVLTSATAQTASTSASISFTGIPSWAKRITVLMSDIVQSVNTDITVQVGSGSTQTTGYISGGATFGNNASGVVYVTTSLYIRTITASTPSAVMVISLIGSNTWVSQHNVIGTATYAGSGSGRVIVTGGALDRVVLTPASGTFTSGTFNILYE